MTTRICPDTGKLKCPTPAEAATHRHHWKHATVFACAACGAFHAGEVRQIKETKASE